MDALCAHPVSSFQVDVLFAGARSLSKETTHVFIGSRTMGASDRARSLMNSWEERLVEQQHGENDRTQEDQKQ